MLTNSVSCAHVPELKRDPFSFKSSTSLVMLYVQPPSQQNNGYHSYSDDPP